MYSVIIPTLLKSKRLDKLLKDLSISKFVDEIILIDNSGNSTPESYKELCKIKLVKPKQNLYVTASWNLGVQMAKNEYIAICNDDINFNPNIFEITTEIKGLLGQSADNYEDDYNEYPNVRILEGNRRPYGWGCLIITQKKYWIPISEELRIWYNDDWIIRINPHPKFILNNFTIKTEMSTTSDNSEFDSIKAEDQRCWIKILRDVKKTHKYRNIMSL